MITTFNTMKEKEVVPGFHGRFVHSPHLTVASWRIEKGASLPQHHHEHEQITHLLEGKFKITVDQTTTVLVPGDVVIIPPNIPHEGEALTSCKIIDIFYPAREDYQ
jgi:quercetin dioxygenase-like cupin family protein